MEVLLMTNKTFLILAAAAAVFIIAFAAGISFAKAKRPVTAVFETSLGSITCELYPSKAPLTVKNFIGLANGGVRWIDPLSGQSTDRSLYDNTIFHRVIPDFMIQGGDPLGNGTGGPGYRFEDEIDPALTFENKGILAMANAGPNTNGSQFFITVAPAPWLNGKHTIFGKVIKGQDVADKISLVKRGQNDRPIEPVVLKRIVISGN
jgi:peptidyl-prolyl cis-trans isomerase A (cyclophilin A)